MPVNPGIEYQLAQQKSLEAKTPQEKLRALEEMLQKVPKHKSSENLVREIRQRIAKLKQQLEKEKTAKGKRFQISIKKEGAAQIVIVGVTNVGKSLLLNRLTNAKAKEAPYGFTTRMPELGTLEYEGIKLQVVEIPAITENFLSKENGPAFMNIIRNADLIMFLITQKNQLSLILQELDRANIKINEPQSKEETIVQYKKAILICNSSEKIKISKIESLTLDILKNDLTPIKKLIWKHLDLIYVFTKAPGKKKDYPPVALEKGSTVEDVALHVHKDFIKTNIKSQGKNKIIIRPFARVWGKSVRFDGQTVGMEHVLEEGDVVELHRGK